MFPPNFKSQLIEALVEWLWRSWISFGVSGHGIQSRADRVIDPEVLLLASSHWARYDARLFDEIIDWLCLHGHFIHLQRMQNLLHSGLGDARVLSAISAVLVETSIHKKWKALVEPPFPQDSVQPLFLSTEREELPWGPKDPLFAAQGFHRGPVELRQLSQSPDPRRAENFSLKLRSIFGTNARAEIVLHLLTNGPATATEIARRSGYTTRSILLPLREMALSGHLMEPPRPKRQRSQRGTPPAAATRGPSMAYALRPDEWSFLRTWDSPAGFPVMESPAPLLILCLTVLAHNETSAGGSDALQRLQFSQAVAGPLENIHRHGLSGKYGLPMGLQSDQLVQTLADRLPDLIAEV
jgi:AraC-like DNA-binding protein